MGRPIAMLIFTFLLLTRSPAAFAQTDTRSGAAVPPAVNRQQNQLAVSYAVGIDSTDASGYTVFIHVYSCPQKFRLAMATHREYDDRFWRYIRDFKVWPPASFEREDSAVWSIRSPGTQVSISYRVGFPPPAPLHFSHRPFLTAHGGLIGDLHSFMYPVGYENTGCAVTLNLPYGWGLAGGIDPMPPPTADEPPRQDLSIDPAGGQARYPHYFRSASIVQLLDAPILVGRLRRWAFPVDGVLHEIAYLPATSSLDLDTAALAGNIQKIVRTTHDIFRAFPYRHYTFLIEDASAGALEHGNSVTVGITPADLSNPASGIFEEIAHEFFHAWNGMSIQPPGYTGLNYGRQQLSPGLWFTEGVTMFYTDLIARRSGLPLEDSTRLSHLTRLITRYISDTGNSVLPP
ncbi:MAG TPA: hypothetical protein VHE54_05270, partial [Puia sp.]|nr:hypothetical protein [Puia sp.]